MKAVIVAVLFALSPGDLGDECLVAGNFLFCELGSVCVEEPEGSLCAAGCDVAGGCPDGGTCIDDFCLEPCESDEDCDGKLVCADGLGACLKPW